MKILKHIQGTKSGEVVLKKKMFYWEKNSFPLVKLFPE